MEQSITTIQCPNCGQEIDVNDILYHQLDDELRRKYNDELAREQRKFQAQADAVNKEKAALESEKRQLQEQISQGIREGVKSERQKLEQKLRSQLEEEQSERINAMQQELSGKTEQLKEFNRAKSDIERLKREKEELRAAMELETEKKLNQLLAQEREKIRKAEEVRVQLKVSEKDQVISQLKEQLQEAHRKAEQGSMQLQGEVQELAIEEWLAEQFPLDTIEEIKKGQRGADCLQTVNTHSRRNCGSIYYESKRTKAFQPAWIEKFKSDIQDKGADIGVLVTETMPADMERLGLKDGVWICDFEEFKGLCHVLRDSVVRLSRAVAVQENKGDKMGMLYDYLTGNEFSMQVEAIVEGFTQLQTDLESEKRSMQGIWKKREKQIQKVLLNTNHMYNSVKGIAGNAVQAVPLLELPPLDDEDEQ
jgi:hypothetical protein